MKIVNENKILEEEKISKLLLKLGQLNKFIYYKFLYKNERKKRVKFLERSR